MLAPARHYLTPNKYARRYSADVTFLIGEPIAGIHGWRMIARETKKGVHNMSENNIEQDPEEGSETSETQSAAAQAELEGLQAEVAELRRQVADGEAAREAPRHRWRRLAVGLLVALGCLVLAVGNPAFWLRGTVLNTNRWVATVGPLSQSPVIVNAVGDYVVEGLYSAVDLEQLTYEVLPEGFKALSGPLTRVLRETVSDAVATVLQSDQFHDVWLSVNRTVHRTVVGILRGEGSLLYVTGGDVTVDLGDAFGFVEETLGFEGLDLFAGDHPTTFVLLSNETLAILQRAVAVLDTVGLVLPFVALAAFVVAWFVSLWRRRTLLWIGVGVAITMAVSLVVFGLVQPAALASIVDPRLRDVAGEIWGIVIRGLYVQTVLLLVVGVLIALGVWVAGPAPRAVAARTAVRGWWGRLRA